MKIAEAWKLNSCQWVVDKLTTRQCCGVVFGPSLELSVFFIQR